MKTEKDTYHTGVAVKDAGEERLRNDQAAVEQRTDERNESRDTWDDETFEPLFESNQAEQFRTQWLEIQSRFVDNPGVSVKEADALVSHVIKNITNSFADQRISLENQWKKGDKVSTEDLRLALQHYRSFFNRLLALKP